MSNVDNNKKIQIDADSVTTIFSSGKSVAPILLACMVDEGLLDY